MTKVMAFGTFDFLHPGHEAMLREAKNLGDYLVVVIARDSTVLKVKGKLPRIDEATRLENLKKLRIADACVLGETGDYHDVIRKELPDIIALGYDQQAFTQNLDSVLQKKVKIVRLQAYFPEKYKSSKLDKPLV